MIDKNWFKHRLPERLKTISRWKGGDIAIHGGYSGGNTGDLQIDFIPGSKMPWNLIGRQIANRWTWLYENTFLRSIFPPGSMEIELKVIK